MEPSQASGEFSGNNESGWTAYIGSHLRKETCYNDDEEDDGDEKSVDDDGEDGDDDDDGDDSDDSMASDASSGPSHLQYLGINSEGSHGSDQLIKHKDNDHKNLFSGKRTSKQARKRRYGKTVEVKQEEDEDEEEEDLLLEADSAGSHV